MLHNLGSVGWRDLKDRRRDLRLALLYKIVTGHVAINPDHIVLLAVDSRTRANHRYKFSGYMTLPGPSVPGRQFLDRHSNPNPDPNPNPIPNPVQELTVQELT